MAEIEPIPENKKLNDKSKCVTWQWCNLDVNWADQNRISQPYWFYDDGLGFGGHFKEW